MKTPFALLAAVLATLAGVVPMANAASPQAISTGSDNNSFAADLFTQLDKTSGDKNLFLSPYSISAALAMTAQGARGKTADQMRSVLHVPANAAAYQTGMAEITTALNPQKAPFELSVSNNLWVDQSFPLSAGFVRDSKTTYAAGVVPVDFVHQAEAARKQINSAIADQTHDKILDLLGAGSVDRSTALVLTNAIYFKGTWQNPFPKDATTDQPFHAPGGDQTVPMMRSPQATTFAYAETDDAQIVALPYKGAPTPRPPAGAAGGGSWAGSGPPGTPATGPSTLSMLIILPKKADGLAAVEQQATADNIAKWAGSLARRPVQVFLPRFTMTTQFELSPNLQAMGMTDAFTRAADFTGISDSAQNKLYISAVIHKAFIDVNEEGTEAAAATAVVVARALAMPANRIEFRADHPFLFLIRHEPTGSILFLGHVNSVK